MPSDAKRLAALAGALALYGSKRKLVADLKKLPGGKRGHPKTGDDVWLFDLEIICRIAERDGIKRHTTLKRWAAAVPWEKNNKGAAARYARKLREQNFTNRKVKALLKKHCYPDISKLRVDFENGPKSGAWLTWR